MLQGHRSLFLVVAGCLQGVFASLLRHGLRTTGQAPDLWAATAKEDHNTDLTQEIQLTRTSADGWYVATLKLGGNDSQVIVDTGSPWLWSYGGSEQSGVDVDAKPEAFSITYLSAELGGNAVKESVALHSDGTSSVGQCKAGRATSGDEFWLRQGSGVQGVLGLACGTADSGAGAAAASSLQTGLSCVTSALGTDDANAAVFALRLNAQGGTLSFGIPPFDLLHGLVKMPPALQCGNWRAPLRVSLPSVGNTASKDFGFASAILDSAAPGIIGLSEHVAALAQTLGARIDVREGKMVFVTPCSRADDLPAVELHLGPASHEAVVQLSGSELLMTDSADPSGKQCRLVFSGWDSPQWILGMPFFRAVRGVVFNPFTQSVSIAP